MNTLVYQQKQGVPCAALFKDGALYEYRRGNNSPVESLYLGKVNRVMKDLHAAFVRLTGKQEGFLPFKTDETLPRPGDTLYVQIKKPAIGGKAPFLTRDIALTGRYLLYLPYAKRDALSRRIEDQDERAQALSKLQALPRDEGAFIARSAFLSGDEKTVYEEAAALTGRWASVKAQSVSPPALLMEAPSALAKLLRDIRETVDEVVTDDPNSVADLALPVRESTYPMALFKVEEKLREALRRRITLRSGAQIVIDPCEAMTVIDVNSAASSFKRDKDTMALNINLEAAKEIARILRLRGTGGMIAVDFIDMASDAGRAAVRSAMEAEMKTDRVKTTVHEFTALGLLEMTRMRSDEKQEAERCICPYCQGSGIRTGKGEETIDA